MNNPLQEDLLGYVLGALDAQEHRDLQQRIDQDPDLEERLLQIKASLLPLESVDSGQPLPGLARRTCESTAIWQRDEISISLDHDLLSNPHNDDLTATSADGNIALGADESDLQVALKPRRWVASTDRILHPSTWSIPDVLVAVALMAIVCGILFPAISVTRTYSRISACQENLQRAGHALHTYSSIHDGLYPSIPDTGPLGVVGVFGPTLVDAQLLENDCLICPGVRESRPRPLTPSCSQVLAAESPEELRNYQDNMAVDYGYTMGFCENGRYCKPRQRGRSGLVLLADRPSIDLEGRESRNHNGWGQNVLYDDLHTAFISGTTIGHDALFLNDYGVVAPGANINDNVIAPGNFSLARAIELVPVLETAAE